MKKTFTILASLFFCISAFGQKNLGLKANGGLSRIANDLRTKTFYVPSGQIGLFYNFHLNDKSLLGTELLFVQIEGKEQRKGSAVAEPGLMINDNLYEHISYIGIPIYYGFKINKLTMNLGIQTSFAIASDGLLKKQSSFNGGTIVTEEIKYDNLEIKKYNIGAIIGFSYNLTDKFAIEELYNYGINSITVKNSSVNVGRRVQQLTLGLRYTFFSIKK